jgi:hypothetical protein
MHAGSRGGGPLMMTWPAADPSRKAYSAPSRVTKPPAGRPEPEDSAHVHRLYSATARARRDRQSHCGYQARQRTARCPKARPRQRQDADPTDTDRTGNPHRLLLYQLIQEAEPGRYRYDLVCIAGRMQRERSRVGLHAPQVQALGPPVAEPSRLRGFPTGTCAAARAACHARAYSCVHHHLAARACREVDDDALPARLRGRHPSCCAVGPSAARPRQGRIARVEAGHAAGFRGPRGLAQRCPVHSAHSNAERQQRRADCPAAERAHGQPHS